jgi:anti-sigma regulatory factor (Ser/Thr protein kinase)
LCFVAGIRGYLTVMVPLIDSGSGIAVLAESLEIDATPDASARARRWLDGIPQLRSLGQVAFDVRLLVTELVSNSVRHAGLGSDDRIVVRLDLDERRLRVEVQDRGSGFDATHLRAPDNEGGRGLQIVSAIAHRWGQQMEHGSLVWFEIDREPASRLSPRLAAADRPARTPPG